MSPVSYRALEPILNGLDPAIKPGEIVPATFRGTLGEENPRDFDRLLQLGVVEDAATKHPDAPDGAPAADGAPPDAPPAAKRKRRAKPTE